MTKIVESPEDYDVVIIGDMFVDQLREAGVLETFDSSKLSNISGIYENARAPMGEGYGPAYTFNRLGIVYDSAFCDVEIKEHCRPVEPGAGGQHRRAGNDHDLRPAVLLCDCRCLRP